MEEYSEVFVTSDVAKKKHAVAVAEGPNRGGPVSWRCREQSAADRTDDQEIGGSLRSSACLLRGRTNGIRIARFRRSGMTAWWLLRR